MRQSAGTLNRTWLAVLGVFTLAAGTLILLTGAGTLHTLTNGAVASGETPVVGDVQAMAAPAYVTAIVLVVGVLAGIVGLLWILAQIPRKNPTSRYRLHQDPAQGTTVCDPGVLASAVEHQTDNLPGVVTSSVLLRGTATEPELSMKVTVNNRADIQDLISRIRSTVIPGLATALETPLRRTGIQIEVSPRAANTGTTVGSTGTVIH